MTTLEIILLTVVCGQGLVVVALAGALWHQEQLVIAQLRWFQQQLGASPQQKDKS